MSFFGIQVSGLDKLALSQVRGFPFDLTSDEITSDPSSVHGHQGNNDVFVLNGNDNFQLFRSGPDLTYIHHSGNTASYWGGHDQTIYDDGEGTLLRFSEFNPHSVKIYDLASDPTARIVLYNAPDHALVSDGHGGTLIGGWIDAINATIRPDQVTFSATAAPPSTSTTLVSL